MQLNSYANCKQSMGILADLVHKVNFSTKHENHIAVHIAGLCTIEQPHLSRQEADLYHTAHAAYARFQAATVPVLNPLRFFDTDGNACYVPTEGAGHVMTATMLHLILEFDFLPEVNVMMATLSTADLAWGQILTAILTLGGNLTIALTLGGILMIALALEELQVLLPLCLLQLPLLLLLLLLIMRLFHARWQLNMTLPPAKVVQTTLAC